MSGDLFSEDDLAPNTVEEFLAQQDAKDWQAEHAAALYRRANATVEVLADAGLYDEHTFETLTFIVSCLRDRASDGSE